MALKSIAVFGGNGFLGKRICQQGIESGYKVISFTRSGKPPTLTSHHDLHWLQQVQWEKADILKPDTYKKQLNGVDTVVHSMGLLFENLNYKLLLDSELNLFEDLKNLQKSILGGTGPNPMARTTQNSYASIQRDSAVLLADILLKKHSKKAASSPPVSFVYISADQELPIVPSGYITTKREAETELRLRSPGIRSIIMRPGFMYDELDQNPRKKRNIVKGVLQAGFDLKNCVLGDSVPLVNGIIRPIVSTQKVAREVFKKIEDKSFFGIVPLDEIARGR